MGHHLVVVLCKKWDETTQSQGQSEVRRHGVRSLVNPQVKQEGHPRKKVFKTHKGPDEKETFMLDEGSQD